MFNNDWDLVLKEELRKPYLLDLAKKINFLYETRTIYPPKKYLFNAFNKTPYKNVKVVILGQDPYHSPNMAHGLSFSTLNTVLPPSLKNIYKELHDDLGIEIPKHGNLEKWTSEGVFLLNTILTVEAGKPLSHQNLGWDPFINKTISLINEKKTRVIFILWGKNAISKKYLITNPIHKIIESSHPSPFSANISFFGSKPFSKANHYLQEMNQKTINWNL